MNHAILGGVAMIGLVAAVATALRRRRRQDGPGGAFNNPRQQALTDLGGHIRSDEERPPRSLDASGAPLGQEQYLLPGEGLDVDLRAWSALLPPSYKLVAMNLFCDVFVLDEMGAVHMLEPSAAGMARIAASIEEFHYQLAADADGRLLRPLVNACRRAGKVPSVDQCYAFTTLPLFGGKYIEENVWICSRREWLDFTADVYRTTHDLPDGAIVKLQVRE